MTTEHFVKDISLLFVAVPWGVLGALLAFSEYRKILRDKEHDDDHEGGGGGGEGKPVTPYDIDPDFDPSDWWKHDEPKKAARN